MLWGKEAECECWVGLSGEGRRWGGSTFLFDVLSLAGLGALGDGFAEEGHEFAVAGGVGRRFSWVFLVARVLGGECTCLV